MMARFPGTWNIGRPGLAEGGADGFAEFPSRAALYSLLFILLVAGGVRLYGLGVPAMWFDEILVPITAQFPAGYIIERSIGTDIHPPVYALFIKMVMLLGQAEWLFRLPSALCGVASVFLMFLLGRTLFSENVGLLGAALLASNPWHIFVSREVRPYALLICCTLVSLCCLVSMIRNPSRRGMALFTAVSAVLCALHFEALLIVGTEVLIYGLYALRRRGAQALAGASFLALANAAVALPLLFLLVNRKSEIGQGAPFATTCLLIADKLAESVFFDLPLPVRMAGVLVLGFGVVVSLIRNSSAAAVLLLFVGVPLSAIAVTGYIPYFNPWHLLFVTPALFLFAGAGVSTLTRQYRFVPALVCAALAFFVWHGYHDRFYLPESYSKYRADAGKLAGFLQHDDVVLYPDEGSQFIYQWYHGDRRAPGAGGQGDEADRSLVLVCPGHAFGHLFDSADTMAERYGRPVVSGGDGGLGLHRYAVRKRAPIPIPGTPSTIVLSSDPFQFFACVDTFSNITIEPVFGGKIYPGLQADSGSYAYTFANDGSQYPYHVLFTLEYENIGRDNRLVVKYAFDGEAEQIAFSSTGPDKTNIVPIQIIRDAPFKMLRLKVEMVRKPYTAKYVGNLSTVHVKKIKAYFRCPH